MHLYSVKPCVPERSTPRELLEVYVYLTLLDVKRKGMEVEITGNGELVLYFVFDLYLCAIEPHHCNIKTTRIGIILVLHTYTHTLLAPRKADM